MKRLLKNVLPLGFRVEIRRAIRGIINAFRWPKPSRKHVLLTQSFAIPVARHSSKLLRVVPEKLTPLQQNKVHNLEIACASLDGLLLEPNDIFSFCAAIGRTTRRKGYKEGLEMRDGQLVGAPGGGLCQLANLIYWMALHLNLKVLERHRHEVDLFPDDDRVVPFGMGATVFYNYHDLRIQNTCSRPLVLRTCVKRPLLHGAFYSDRPLPFVVRIVEKEHRFFRDTENVVWRENRVTKYTDYLNEPLAWQEEIAHNRGRVAYTVDENKIMTG